MKIRHILLALLAVLAIAFMQPLVSFLGGLTLLLGVGAFIFRDLSPASQEAVEHRVLGWLRRARTDSTLETGSRVVSHRRMPAPPANPAMPAEGVRRARVKAPAPLPGSISDAPPSPDTTRRNAPLGERQPG